MSLLSTPICFWRSLGERCAATIIFHQPLVRLAGFYLATGALFPNSGGPVTADVCGRVHVKVGAGCDSARRSRTTTFIVELPQRSPRAWTRQHSIAAESRKVANTFHGRDQRGIPSTRGHLARISFRPITPNWTEMVALVHMPRNQQLRRSGVGSLLDLNGAKNGPSVSKAGAPDALAFAGCGQRRGNR